MTSARPSKSRARPASTILRACAGLGWAVAACSAEHAAPEHSAGGSPDPRENDRPTVSAPPSTVPPGPEAGTPAPTATPVSDASADALPPRVDLYDPERIPHFTLTFDDAALAILSSTAEVDRETWVHGRLTDGTTTFEDVGVRRKGSHTFRALPKKAALKIKLNKWVSGQKLHGLTELTLNNMMDNPTSLSERLTFHVFRALGLPAMRANTARVTINGEDYGVYSNVETPNRGFLERTFGAQANTLYEGNWGSWMPGDEVGMEIDVPDRDAPTGTSPDLSALFRAVAATPNASLPAGVSPHLDTSQWLRFAAVEGIVAHCDGYGFGRYGASHNYFLAGDTSGTFRLLPWSVDTTLADFPEVVDTSLPVPDTLLSRCRLVTDCWDAFRNETRSLLTRYEALGLLELAKRWHDQIDPLVRNDPKRETSIDYYETTTRKLFEWIPARPALVRAQLGL